MELAIFVYFAEMLNALSFVALIFLLFSFIGLIICCVGVFFAENENFSVKHIKIFGGLTLFFATIFVLLPTTKTAYTMAGAYTARKLVQSDAANEVGQKVYKIINQKLDSYIVEETKKDTK